MTFRVVFRSPGKPDAEDFFEADGELDAIDQVVQLSKYRKEDGQVGNHTLHLSAGSIVIEEILRGFS